VMRGDLPSGLCSCYTAPVPSIGTQSMYAIQSLTKWVVFNLKNPELVGDNPAGPLDPRSGPRCSKGVGNVLFVPFHYTN